MIIKYDGAEYEYDLDEIDLKQATIIFKKYGVTLLELQNGLQRGEPNCLRVAYWLMLAQNGQNTNIDNVNCKIVKFARAYDEALLEENRAEIDAKRAQLEAKVDSGEELTPAEADFLAAVKQADDLLGPKEKTGKSASASTQA